MCGRSFATSCPDSHRDWFFWVKPKEQEKKELGVYLCAAAKGFPTLQPGSLLNLSSGKILYARPLFALQKVTRTISFSETRIHKD
jgi:hypothetical protein